MMWIETLLEPPKWPLKWRRAFLLTLPITGPIWLLVWGTLVFLMLISLPFFGVMAWVSKMWEEQSTSHSKRGQYE